MSNGQRYRVFFTPLLNLNVYGAAVEVTDFVTFDGILNIKRSIDSQDYDIGAYYFGDIDLKVINQNGRFNDSDDFRSMFKYSRDLCKVRVQFENTDATTITFDGLVNEEATKADATGDLVTFRVLSKDSVIRNGKIAGGTIASGVTCQSAIVSILDDPRIASVLTVNPVNIVPDYNFIIDVGSAFDNVPSKDALNLLLLASNSIMLVDNAGVVSVRSRNEDTVKDILTLFGPYDIKRRQNVINLKEYNTGKQRLFTSIKVNNTDATSLALAETFGFKQKQITLDFITNALTEKAIASRLLAEFSSLKIELQIDVPTKLVQSTSILDRVALSWPLRVKPVEGTFLPFVGGAVIGDAMTPLPSVYGSLVVPPNMGFKIIEMIENPKDYVTTLKLRQIGKTISDGWFSTPTSSIIGFGIIGLSKIAGPGAPSWNPSVTGAAKIGSTKIA
jgi:hypothetical protein